MEGNPSILEIILEGGRNDYILEKNGNCGFQYFL